MSEIEYLKEKIRELDEWIESYEGEDEELINKKLDQQERYIKQLSDIRNAFALSQ